MSEIIDTEKDNNNAATDEQSNRVEQGLIPEDIGDDEHIDSVSVDVLGEAKDEIGEIPGPDDTSSFHIERSSSSLTIENVKAFEEATEREHRERSPATRRSSGRSSTLRLKQDVSGSSTPALPPVKTGRLSAAEILSAKSSILQNESENSSSRPGTGANKQLQETSPLPPIGGGEDPVDTVVDSDTFDSSTLKMSLDTAIESSTTELSSGNNTSLPRIMQFKRELPADYAFERETSNLSNRTTDSNSSKKTVSFTEPTERSSSRTSSKKGPIIKTIASKEITKRRNEDGTETLAISIATETEWSWLDSVRVAGKLEFVEAAKQNTEETSDRHIPSGSGLKKRRRRKRHSSLSSGQLSDTDYDAESTSSSLVGKSRLSGSIKPPEVLKEESMLDVQGVPPLELSSSESDSDFEIVREKEDSVSDLLPGVGPPTILQYQRESQQPQVDCKDPTTRHIAEGGIWSGYCEFCEEPIKPFPTLEMQQRYPASELFCCDEYQEFYELYCCDDYKQFAEFTIQNGPEASFPVDEKIDISPHPPYGSKQARRAAKERAAQRMREREMARQRAAGANQSNFYASGMRQDMKRQSVVGDGGRENLGDKRQSIKDKIKDEVLKRRPSLKDRQRLIDGLVTSRNKRGSTTASVSTMNKSLKRLSSKWDVSLEVTENAMSRLQQKLIAKVDIFPDHSSLFARQMKTINYAYSSQKCRDEGWTLRPPTPLYEEPLLPEVFEPEPLPPAFSVRSEKQERPLIQKYYEDGSKFLTIFADGTGNVFYPSGNIAIVISSVKQGQYTYVVLEDMPNNASMLALFDSKGRGTCYYNSGIIRLNMNEYGGIFCNSNGAKKKRWNWRDLVTHVHAPPFQPICIALNKYLAVRVQSQDQIYLSVNCDMRTVRFNIGVKLKLVNPANLPETEIEDDDIYIRDMTAYVQSILDKVGNVMKFSKSPKLDQIQPPLHLSHQIQRNARLKQKALQQKTSKSKDSALVTVN
ncbi:uncharacterized protein LOC100378540 [Saccoglossus kowalevskii]|uniref:Uncharacterized protein LOC100378540 n=1 Tax=Saccoglossus kowalevskii TaxID=10224 RepID=A0ABM0MTS5_SACKO|nr:PREDICTED: uncharacterized protein LOC100378540 [Saccoglossus kowalevskii]